MKKNIFLLTLLLILLLTTVACTNPQKSEGSIRLGVLPDINSIPLIIAAEEGIFEDNGVDVEIIYFTSARERDQAFQSGNIDAANSDILNVIFLNDAGFPVKITSNTVGSFVIVSREGLEDISPEDLVGLKIGLSENTIIEFVVDMVLNNYGLEATQVDKEFIAEMPLRREMLLQGKIDAAGLPEPLASLSLLRGGSVVAESSQEGLMPGVIYFSNKIIEERPQDIEGFYRGYVQTLEIINEDINPFLALLVEKARFPEELVDSFTFPEYNYPELPTENDVEMAMEWLKSKGLVDREFRYEELIVEDYIK